MSEHEELLRDGVGAALRPPSRRALAALPLEVVGAGMLVRRLRVQPRDVVFVKGLVEASDGLAGVFAEQGGELLLAAPPEREAELAELLADLQEELSGCTRFGSTTVGQEP
jgi:Domain of unknown function (DUF4911)